MVAFFERPAFEYFFSAAVVGQFNFFNVHVWQIRTQGKAGVGNFRCLFGEAGTLIAAVAAYARVQAGR